jgi:hypothetical protein
MGVWHKTGTKQEQSKVSKKIAAIKRTCESRAESTGAIFGGAGGVVSLDIGDFYEMIKGGT